MKGAQEKKDQEKMPTLRSYAIFSFFFLMPPLTRSAPPATSYSQDKVAARVRMKEKESAAAVNLSFSFRTPATS